MTSSTDDKWQWLEAQFESNCLEWVEQQNETTYSHLNSLAGAQDLESYLRKLASGDARNPDYWIAGHCFRLRRTNVNKQGILEIARRQGDGSPGDFLKIVDIDELGRAEKQNYELAPRQVVDMPSLTLGPNSNALILPLSVGGSDTVVLRELNIENGDVVENGFHTKEGRISFTWMDYDHILISHCLDNRPTTSTGWPRDVYFWTRGTALNDAKLVWQADSTDMVTQVTSINTMDQRYGLISRWKDWSSIEYFMIDADCNIKTIPLPRNKPLKLMPSMTADHFISTFAEPMNVDGREISAGTIVACCITEGSPDFGKISVVYKPHGGETILDLMSSGIQASQSRVYMTLSKRGTDRCVTVEYRNGTWVVIGDHKTKDGNYRVVVSCDPYSNDNIVEESGLVDATQIWLQHGDQKLHKLHQQASLFNPELYDVHNRTTRSKDGTDIDYVTISPKSKNSRPFQVQMTGYGGFGIPFPRTYLDFMHGGISLVPWLEGGGAFAVPYIRGGGERGQEWHEAARQEKRQCAYDDFVAVAEELISTGFTAAGKIGVFGSSNGGLLAAVVGTQRPDLFAAVVSDAPITDMLRFHHMSATGGAWLNEYGDPEDPKMAKVLNSYSPFHNVRDRVKYPAFLVTVSARDDRVGVGHARKFVARLQDAGAADAYLLEYEDGGHLGSDAFRNAFLMSRRVAFFRHHLR